MFSDFARGFLLALSPFFPFIHSVNNSQVSILHSRVYDKHTQSTGTGAKSKRRERLFYASVQISMMQVSLKILWTKNKYTLNKGPLNKNP